MNLRKNCPISCRLEESLKFYKTKCTAGGEGRFPPDKLGLIDLGIKYNNNFFILDAVDVIPHFNVCHDFFFLFSSQRYIHSSQYLQKEIVELHTTCS